MDNFSINQHANASIEKVISNQEFNSLNGSHNSGKMIRTGNSTILKFQKEVSDSAQIKFYLSIV